MLFRSNEPEFVAGPRHTNYLYMHPEDARAAGIGHGDIADLSSDAGRVRVPVHWLSDLQPGSVALPTAGATSTRRASRSPARPAA